MTDKKLGAGGYRVGSGRPKGTGRYGEKTCPIRVPISLLPKIKALLSNPLSLEHTMDTPRLQNMSPSLLTLPNAQNIPFYATRVAAGGPLPAGEEVEADLNLNEYLIKRPASTFLVRAEGDSMINAGIQENDMLVVDRSVKPTHGKIIIAAVNGHLTVKRLLLTQHTVQLMPENPRYTPITIDEEMDFRIWGVVVHVIHSLL